MDGFDDGQRLRNRQKAADDAASQDPGIVARGAPCMVVQTATKATYPTTASAFYACKIISILGTESEGSPGSLTLGSDIIYCLNLGSAIPPTGTNVIATFTDSRWSFRFDG